MSSIDIINVSRDFIHLLDLKIFNAGLHLLYMLPYLLDVVRLHIYPLLQLFVLLY